MTIGTLLAALTYTLLSYRTRKIVLYEQDSLGNVLTFVAWVAASVIILFAILSTYGEVILKILSYEI